MHWFLDPIIKHYADFDGRVGRQAFWMFVLISLVFSMIASALSDMIGAVYSLAVLLPALAITARRLHDIDKSGWWQLLWLVPVIGWLILVVWCATKGDGQPNRFDEQTSQADINDSLEGSNSPTVVTTATTTTVSQSNVPPSSQV